MTPHTSPNDVKVSWLMAALVPGAQWNTPYTCSKAKHEYQGQDNALKLWRAHSQPPSASYANGVRSACSHCRHHVYTLKWTAHSYMPCNSTCTKNTLTKGTEESCWYTEPVLDVPHHHLLWHYAWGYRRDNSDSEAKPTWHTDHLVVILTSGTSGMCWYVIYQQWPLPPAMLYCSPQGYCEENHCHMKPACTIAIYPYTCCILMSHGICY